MPEGLNEALATLVVARTLEWLAGARWLSGSMRADFLRSAIHFAVFALALSVCRQPLSAGLLSIIGLAALMIAGTAKHKLLDEPVVFSDLALIAQILRHPSLYHARPRDNLRLWLAGLGCALLFGIVVQFATSIEPGKVVVNDAAAIAFLGIAIHMSKPLCQSSALIAPPDYGSDLFGLPAALLLQWRAWRDESQRDGPEPPANGVSAEPDTDVVVLQLESFVDLAAHGYGDAPLVHWPALCRGAYAHGSLAVEAIGANTVRTEFSVLTGLPADAIGFDRFNPYLRAKRYAGHAWPTRFANAGWRTVFIHPNDRRFFRRDRVMPELGFGHCLWLEHFDRERHFDSGISDDAVFGAVSDCLDETAEPVFIFAVTMENHGPWHGSGIGGADGVETYLANLRRTDIAVSRLVEILRKRKRRTLLVAYGDHVPALDTVRARLWGTQTDYLIIDTARDSVQRPRNDEMKPSQLISLALQASANRNH